MISTLLYIGPGLSVGGLILVGIILLLVLVSIGYLVYYRIKRAVRKNKNKE